MVFMNMAVHKLGRTNPQRCSSTHSLCLACNGWVAERVTQASIDMPDLLLFIERQPTQLYPQHTALTSPADIRRLYPNARSVENICQQ